jgi:uncharacterized repeat protein (TIGR04076 family)
MFKGATGHTEEAVERLSPGMEKVFRNLPKTMQYELVAEVVKSGHCTAQVKVGDKLVFDPWLNPGKSTGAMCPEALIPVLIQVKAIWEMAPEWAESGKEGPPEIAFRNIRCLDPGFEDGGVGGVVYQMRFEKISP